MSLTTQILWGTLYLGISLVVEIGLLAWCGSVLRSVSDRWSHRHYIVHATLVMGFALLVIVFAHTFQVWTWATAWLMLGVLEDWNTSLYFSMVTYTTLGYGDVVLGPALRIFGSFAAVAGLLAFGLSTAFLVALMSNLLLNKNDRPNTR